MQKTFSICSEPISIVDFIDYCSTLTDSEIVTKNGIRAKKRSAIYYYNIPLSLDIETSSFYDNGNKKSIMYIWQLGINGVATYGRTYDELVDLLEKISEIFNTDLKHRIVIYVHNLSYEFQYIRKHLDIYKVFAIKNRTPIYCITTSGIELRCSYLLSGYSLEMVGKQLTKYNVRKLVGSLDYSKIRHSYTPLSEDELQYAINDVLVVMAYIQEKLDNGENIATIPMTKTGYVRQYTREHCIHNKERSKSSREYRNLIKDLTLNPDEYKMLKRAFIGGFTHANHNKANKLFFDVGSADFTSSYPAVMLTEQFPMTSGTQITITSIDQYKEIVKSKLLVMDVEFTGIVAKVDYDNIISKSKCWICENPVMNNGRIMSADKIATTITNIDFDAICQFYQWDGLRIGKAYVYGKNYLPTLLIESMLKLYSDKTTLKGVEGKEREYLWSKEQLNSDYGMMVTDIIRDENTYIDDTWGTDKADLDKSIEDYNNSKNRFLFYPWGVFITAYARRNLYTGILELKDDYIYSDTDSVKGTNFDLHQKYFETYNKVVEKKIEMAMKYHKLPLELAKPKTIKGVEKMIGVWDMDDGFYTRFKTLGAKRYMVEENGVINITVSGVNKRKAVPYILSKYENPFEAFSNNLEIPAEWEKDGEILSGTGKMTMTYIDDEIGGSVTDYTGKTAYYHELSCIHAEPVSFTMTLTAEYLELINVRCEALN